MKLIQSPVRFTVYGEMAPLHITLHHTAGHRKPSEDYLKQKRLGYHFMIDPDGTVYAYNDPMEVVGHSQSANHDYIGISLVCGSPLPAANELQIQATKELCTYLATGYPTIKTISDHATIDRIVAHRGWKCDPQWPGEKAEQNIWAIKHKYLDEIAQCCGLDPVKYTPPSK